MFWKPSIGLEITGPDLRVVVVEKFFKRQRLVKTEIIPGFLGFSEDERLRVLAAFIRKHKLRQSRVFLTLPKEVGIVRQMEFPVQIADKAGSAASLQVESISPWPLEELYWACACETPSKGSKSFRATIVVVPKATLDPWIESFAKAGLPLSGASLSTSTWAHGATSFWGHSVSMIMLGCEPGSVEGVLVKGGQLSAVTLEGDDISSQAQSVVERLLSLGRVESPDNVKLFAHGSASQGLESDAVVPPLESVGSNFNSYFAAIATALLGLRKTAFDVNLVPVTLRYRYKRIIFAPTIVLAFMLLLLGVAWAVRSPYQTLEYAREIDKEISSLSPQVKDVNSQETELEKLNQRFVTLATHVRQRDSNLEALRELSRILPQDTWISSYNYQDATVSVTGLSNSASQIQKVVEDSPVFRDAQLTATIVKDPSGKDRFSLKAAMEQTK